MKQIVFALLMMLASSLSGWPVAQAQLSDEEVLANGRSLTEQFYAVEIEPVWAQCSPELQQRLGGIEAFTTYRQRGLELYGPELKMFDEAVRNEDGIKFYVRVASFANAPNQAWFVLWGFDDDGVVVFFNIVFAGVAPA